MSSRPQPLLTRAAVVGVCGGIITALTALGLLDDAESKALVAGVGGVFVLLAPIVTAFVTRNAVTPVSDPVTVIDGQAVALVPAGPVVPGPKLASNI
jgi:hypothetical protein